MGVARHVIAARTLAVRSISSEGFVVSEVRAAGEDVCRFDLDMGQIVVVVEGRFRDSDAGGGLCYETGDVVIRSAGRIRAAIPGDARTHLFAVELAPDRAREVESLFARPTTVHLHAERFPRLVARLLREWNAGDRASGAAVPGLLLDLVAAAARAAERNPAEILLPEWLRGAIRLLERPRPGTWRLADVARCAGVPPARLALEFRRLRGCSVGEWVRRIRLQDALHDLVFSAEPLHPIALRAGFHDAPHLVREFKRSTGSTPGAFRAAGRGR